MGVPSRSGDPGEHNWDRTPTHSHLNLDPRSPGLPRPGCAPGAFPLRKGTPLASRVAQGVSGPSSSCVCGACVGKGPRGRECSLRDDVGSLSPTFSLPCFSQLSLHPAFSAVTFGMGYLQLGVVPTAPGPEGGPLTPSGDPGHGGDLNTQGPCGAALSAFDGSVCPRVSTDLVRMNTQTSRGALLGGTTGISAFPLGWPWEAQSSPRVARESWGWRSSHCRA